MRSEESQTETTSSLFFSLRIQQSLRILAWFLAARGVSKGEMAIFADQLPEMLETLHFECRHIILQAEYRRASVITNENSDFA